ncbi:MAG: hypothetical protein R6U98_36010, partial [Pirellulaceae bacterium]
AVSCNVYVTSKKGKILGYSLLDDFECDIMEENVIEQGEFPEDYNKGLLRIRETKSNIEQKDGKCVFAEGASGRLIIPEMGRHLGDDSSHCQPYVPAVRRSFSGRLRGVRELTSFPPVDGILSTAYDQGLSKPRSSTCLFRDRSRFLGPP